MADRLPAQRVGREPASCPLVLPEVVSPTSAQPRYAPRASTLPASRSLCFSPSSSITPFTIT